MKVNEENFGVLSNIIKETGVDYIVWKDAENIDGYIEPYNILNIFLDLLDKIDHQKEEYKELEQDLRENYKPIPFNPYEEYGVSEKDFR